MYFKMKKNWKRNSDIGKDYYMLFVLWKTYFKKNKIKF